MTATFWILLLIIAFVVVGSAIFALGITVLWYSLIGLIIGMLGRMLVKGGENLGLLATILAGLIGSVGGGLIANAMDLGGIVRFLVSIVVAAIVVALATSSARKA